MYINIHVSNFKCIPLSFFYKQFSTLAKLFKSDKDDILFNINDIDIDDAVWLQLSWSIII